ncbi:hypothetical protein NFI96_015106 [Prochilodus magdalenae]|nr:hypothetical protein NFI96_015106 [Prochilodus magdalenae]
MKLVQQYFLFYVLSFLATGKASTLPYESIGGECVNSSTEFFSSLSNLCCSKCKPGSHLVEKCSKERDTVCMDCEEGTFSEAMTFHSNCFACRTCSQYKGLRYNKTCTSSSDAVCECKPGYYCNLHESGRCVNCRKYTKCPPGMGDTLPGTKSILCDHCPDGKFSNVTDTQPCRQHTQCEAEGRPVLQPGTSMSDAVCGPPRKLLTTPQSTPQTTAQITTQITTQTTPPVASSEIPPTSTSVPCDDLCTSLTAHTKKENEDKIGRYWIVGAVVAVLLALLVLLTVTAFVICHRKDLTKPPVKETKPTHAFDSALLFSKPECQRLLKNSQMDPTMSSSSSSSSSDSHSQSTGASQDSIHTDQPVVSSPCVNVSFTATFNCQVNPTMGSCSIPINSVVQPQPAQTEVPLSQEEQLGVSCEEENTKDALQSVQESGMTVF